MIQEFTKLSQMRFGELMCVYEEGNVENALDRYAGMDKNAAVLQVEQDFYNYLDEVFFLTEHARYFVLSENGKYISALRVEPYEDGMLLAALETRPGFRRRGFAKKLVRLVAEHIEKPIYSHVLKDNMPSILTHYACGFERVLENAHFIDGTVSEECCTLLRK